MAPTSHDLPGGSLPPERLSVATSVKGFMPLDEGATLYRVGLHAAQRGPLLEVGSYCGKSAVYLGTAAERHNSVLFTIDHHRGSEENQAGWEWHDREVVDPESGLMDTLPFLRRTLWRAGLEESVVPIVGRSDTVARFWATPLALLFIDGGHAEEIAQSDFDRWSPHVRIGGLLAFHDIFEDPAQGGQAPWRVWNRALATGNWRDLSDWRCGSLRVAERLA